MPVNIHNTDYVYMHTNNAIISNNQSKDLIVLWCLQNSYSRLIACKIFKINIYFYCYYSHTSLHSTNDGAGVFTGRCFNLFTSNA